MEGDPKNIPNPGNHPPKPSRLDELEKSLYRRDRSIPKLHREQLSTQSAGDVAPEWKHDPEKLTDTQVNEVRTSFFSWIFIASFAFFAVAIAFGAYVIFGGSDSVSSKNVDISVIGPVSVAAGTPLELQVAVQNKNSSGLEDATLIVEYPSGAKDVNDPTKNLTYERIDIGKLSSGQLVNKAVKAILYGDIDTVEHLKLSVQYHFAGSNTAFYADSGYDVTINSSPVSVRITSLDEVTSGQLVDIAVDVVANSNTLIKGVLLQATYPFGFTPTDFSPKPASGTTLWDIGDMHSGDKRTIHVRGSLTASDGEMRVFKFETGIAGPKDDSAIATAFVTAVKAVTVQKPFLGIGITLDNVDSKEYAAAPESTVHAIINYSNNTSSDINNGEISVKLNGDLYDKSFVSAHGGYYSSSDNTIIWNNTTNPELASITAGSKGSVSFDFKTLPVTAQSGSVSQPEVSFDVNVGGKRLSSNSVQESVSALDSRTIKISSDLSLISRMVYSVGPFRNTGPIPPKADNPVTYTVVWSITNTANPISGAKVTATLPSYVTWLGNVVPAGEKISYDSITRVITWAPGSISADAGITKSAREIGFQVQYLPSISQLGTSPDIIGAAELAGEDTWSGASLSDKSNPLTTRISTDPNFLPGQDTVVR